MIRVMIADDNAELNKKYCDFLLKDKEIQIVCRTLDGLETLQKYKEIRPDVLLLDLKMPSMNGIDVINNLSLDTEEKKLCNIIVISGENSLRYNLFNTSKIFRVIPKPVNFDNVLSTIKEITLKNDSNTFSDKDLRHFLFSLNCNVFSDGSKYLADAIILANKNPQLLKNMNDIYNIISEKYSISYKTVKWGIRNSIETMNKNTSNEELCKKLKMQSHRKLTPKYFIPLAISHFNN